MNDLPTPACNLSANDDFERLNVLGSRGGLAAVTAGHVRHLALAFSGGIAAHSRILRSELLAACPVIFALPTLIGSCMVAYAAIWRASVVETLASMFALAAGASVALLALRFEYNTAT